MDSSSSSGHAYLSQAEIAALHLSKEDTIKIVKHIAQNPSEKLRNLKPTNPNFVKEFGSKKATVHTPMGKVAINGKLMLTKLVQRKRANVFGGIKSTLEKPDFVIKDLARLSDQEGKNILFVKSFKRESGNKLLIVACNQKENRLASVHIKDVPEVISRIEKDAVLLSVSKDRVRAHLEKSRPLREKHPFGSKDKANKLNRQINPFYKYYKSKREPPNKGSLER